MNNRRFIELLNLYVDQELSEDDARELEQEIAHDPERRRVYSQYCRMQRACVRLFDQQAAPAPQIEVLTRLAASNETADAVNERVREAADLPRHVAPRRAFAGWFAWGSGALAAAACVTLVVFTSVREADPQKNDALPGTAVATTVPAAPLPERASVAAAAVETTTAPAPSEYRPVFVVNLRPEPGQLAGEAPRFALEEPSLNWLQELRLKPIRRMSADSLKFTPAGGLRNVSPTLLSTTNDQQPSSEMVSFTFQR